MKKIALNIIPALFLIVLVSSCEIEKSAETTQIIITAVDTLGEPIQNGRALLYESEEDYSNKTNKIQSLRTDENGLVVFTGLEPRLYYFIIYKECLQNSKGKFSTEVPLAEGESKDIEVVVREDPGSLIAVNNFSVIVDLCFVGDPCVRLNPGDTLKRFNLAPGSYDYSLYPVDADPEDYYIVYVGEGSISIDCGEHEEWVFGSPLI